MAVTKWSIQAPSPKKSLAYWRGGAEDYYSDTLRGRVMRGEFLLRHSNSDRGDWFRVGNVTAFEFQRSAAFGHPLTGCNFAFDVGFRKLNNFNARRHFEFARQLR